MKKTLLNALLFLAGYILFTIACVIMGYGFWIDWMIFQDESSSPLIYTVATTLEAFSVSIAWISIQLIKIAFLPGLLPWVALKKGAYVKHEGFDKDGCTIFRMAPFDSKSPVILVRNPNYADNIEGFPSYRYYFDGTFLRSAIK